VSTGTPEEPSALGHTEATRNGDKAEAGVHNHGLADRSNPATFFRDYYQKIGTVPKGGSTDPEVGAYLDEFRSVAKSREELKQIVKKIRAEMRAAEKPKETRPSGTDEIGTTTLGSLVTGKGKKIAFWVFVVAAAGVLAIAAYYLKQGRTWEEMRPYGIGILALGGILLVMSVSVAFLKDAPIRLWWKQAYALFVMVLSLGLILVIAGWFSTHVARDAGWLTPSERKAGAPTAKPREDFEVGKSIPMEIALAKDALVLPNPSERPSPEEQASYSMNKWLNWMNDGARPKVPTESLVVLRTKLPWTKNNFAFTAAIRFDHNTKYELLEGCAFLVSPSATQTNVSTYRPLLLHVEEKSDVNENHLIIHELSEGDRVLIIVKLRSRDLKTPMPVDASLYGMQVVRIPPG